MPRIAEEVKKKKQERTMKRKEEKKKSRKLEKPLSSMEPTIENSVIPSKVTGLLDETVMKLISLIHSIHPEEIGLTHAESGTCMVN